MSKAGTKFSPEVGWQTMETVPRDRYILAWGKPTDIDGVRWEQPGVHTVYWDGIDGAFCLKGATWLGPFIEPKFWMEEPEAPYHSDHIGGR